MNARIIFDSKDNREKFFSEVLTSFGLSNWKKLREHLLIPKSMFEFYKNGKISLPLELYKKFSQKLSFQQVKFFELHIRQLEANWGQIKAGKITYSKYRSIFEEGRLKAIQSSKKNMHLVSFNLILDKKLAHFIGLFIGDGFTNKYGSGYIVQFTGDLKEKSFYEGNFAKDCILLFGMKPKIKLDRCSKAIRVNFYSKDLFNLITKRFKISSGRKSHTVLIPDEILNSNEEILLSCIRGIYDAEGCVFLDKRHIYKKPYVRIELHMCNLSLLEQISNILTKNGVENTIGRIKNNLRITIYGEDMVKKFIKKVGFNNPKQLIKLKEADLI